MLAFFNMRQGVMESDDEYLTHFNSKVKNLELAGRSHLFCSSQILDKELSTVTEEEIEESSKRFLAICFLQRADEARYADLLNDL